MPYLKLLRASLGIKAYFRLFIQNFCFWKKLALLNESIIFILIKKTPNLNIGVYKRTGFLELIRPLSSQELSIKKELYRGVTGSWNDIYDIRVECLTAYALEWSYYPRFFSSACNLISIRLTIYEFAADPGRGWSCVEESNQSGNCHRGRNDHLLMAITLSWSGQRSHWAIFWSFVSVIPEFLPE